MNARSLSKTFKGKKAPNCTLWSFGKGHPNGIKKFKVKKTPKSSKIQVFEILFDQLFVVFARLHFGGLFKVIKIVLFG